MHQKIEQNNKWDESTFVSNSYRTYQPLFNGYQTINRKTQSFNHYFWDTEWQTSIPWSHEDTSQEMGLNSNCRYFSDYKMGPVNHNFGYPTKSQSLFQRAQTNDITHHSHSVPENSSCGKMASDWMCVKAATPSSSNCCKTEKLITQQWTFWVPHLDVNPQALQGKSFGQWAAHNLQIAASLFAFSTSC